ncbi:MAG TPA: YicC family protein [Nitrospirae bacterium]|nr:YicC family protein [Nitrospirota bacterium]HDK16436.1 YicC family protein [Nitrospirota bacterium]
MVMTPQSMTGYGRDISGKFRVEIRSSNHKNLDVQINAPSYLFSCEPGIKKIVKKKFSRGRIEIYVRKQEEDNVKLKVNKPLAREYYNALVSLRDELSISDNIKIDILASQRDIFLADEPEIDVSGFYATLEAALEELNKTRVEEGENLIHDITERIRLIEQYTANIEQNRAEFTAVARERLQERLKEFLGDLQIDEHRLIQETAILVEKSDITEEIVRIKSHMGHFEQTLKSADTIGKKLDFIIQELRREINTIGSKAQDFGIANNVVEVKHELEKIREQIQNLQ